MPHVKPTTRVDVIGNLDLSPAKEPGFFLESKQQKKYLLKPPNIDSTGDSIELLAIQNDREYKSMLQLQEDMLENAKIQDEINSNRVKEVYKVQSRLRKRFAEVNMFIKECDYKKHIATKKVTEEEQKHKKLKKQIEKVKSDLKVLTEFRSALIKTVKDFEPYETVINKVIAETKIWSSVKDCIDRCDALMLNQTEIDQMKKTKLDEIESRRSQMVRMANEAALTVLGFMNELSKLERDYDSAHSECLKWEKILANVKDRIADSILTKQKMADGIRHMYNDLCRRRGINPVIKNAEDELDFIKDEIEILQKVVTECKSGKL